MNKTLRIITDLEVPLTSFFDREAWEVLIDFNTNTVTLIKKEVEVKSN